MQLTEDGDIVIAWYQYTNKYLMTKIYLCKLIYEFNFHSFKNEKEKIIFIFIYAILIKFF